MDSQTELSAASQKRWRSPSGGWGIWWGIPGVLVGC